MAHVIQGSWADLAAPDFRDLAAPTICILPLGATEQHGPHLPVSVDSDLAEAVLARAMKQISGQMTVLVLPTMTVTCSAEHGRFPGTLSLRPTTFLLVLADIADSLAANGFGRLVLFNAHGGNRAILDVAARDMRIRHNMIVVTASWFDFAQTDGLFDAEALKLDLHAGESETAAMLAICPERVDMTKAADFRSAMKDWGTTTPRIGLSGQPARPAWIINDLNPDGVCGNAAAAQAETGGALLDSAASGFAAFLSDFAAFDHRCGGNP
jgi:creatinine amidohydrolase